MMFGLLAAGAIVLAKQWLFVAAAQQSEEGVNGEDGDKYAPSNSNLRSPQTKVYWIAAGARGWVPLWGKHLKQDGFEIVRHPKVAPQVDLLVRCCQYPPMVGWAKQKR
jgi:hypothetical protein